MSGEKGRIISGACCEIRRQGYNRSSLKSSVEAGLSLLDRSVPGTIVSEKGFLFADNGLQVDWTVPEVVNLLQGLLPVFRVQLNAI